MPKTKKELQAPTRTKTIYGPSLTKIGQSLKPAELLKRHLAGTLPDIQKRPEYTFDEQGKQIGEDLSSLELHEIHDLARAVRAEYDKRSKELKDENEKVYRQQIIDTYQKEHLAAQAAAKKLANKTSKKEPNSPTPEPPAI